MWTGGSYLSQYFLGGMGCLWESPDLVSDSRDPTRLTHRHKREVYGMALCTGSLANSDMSAVLCVPFPHVLSLCNLKIALRVVNAIKKKSSQVPTLPEGGSLRIPRLHVA